MFFRESNIVGLGRSNSDLTTKLHDLNYIGAISEVRLLELALV